MKHFDLNDGPDFILRVHTPQYKNSCKDTFEHLVQAKDL